MEFSLNAAEGLSPVGQSHRDSAALFTPPPAGLQIVCKPGHSIWHLAGGVAAPDCDGCVRVDARNTDTDGLMNSVEHPEELVSTCMSHYEQTIAEKQEE